ncbi:MAG: nitroreductase family protein [Lachnotalea sp.]
MMTVDNAKCIGCGMCLKDCFPKDIELVDQKANIKNINCIKCGHCIAICPTNAISTDEYDMTDVKEYDKESFSIAPDTLLNFIQFRRSVRQFKEQTIDKEILEQIIEAGRFTQTGINMQDVSYTVVIKQLDAFKLLVLKTLKSMGEHILQDTSDEKSPIKKYAGFWIEMCNTYELNPTEGDKLFFNAPAVIIVSANSEMNGALAASNMELMANALGLGTFFSGFLVAAAAQNPQIKEFINLKEGKKIVSCMVLGYPAIKYNRTVPRQKADVQWS